MMKDQLIKIYRELMYFRYIVLSTLRLKGMNSSDYSILQENIKYKNIHKGKRCFILGNGPSIKDVDFDSLHGEFVFTVNQSARMKDFYKLNTNYHFWADPMFFKRFDDASSEELLNIMKAVNTDNNRPVVFFPLEQKKFIVENNLAQELNVQYFQGAIHFYAGYDHAIDFTGYTPSYCTVVQWCISMAIYMGFKEIYLLGCDNTSLLVTLKSALKQNDDEDYGYHVTENEKRRMEKQLEVNSVEVYTESYLKNIRQYRYLYEYCKKRKIKLVNCSSTTILDSLPRISLESVLYQR
ncbi:hypothetical protein [Mediterraneibacter glycyrrhizinilyticus]|uniref:hypothetical protein n=1 Tax=Mediterraneibacter glycyrrhizinilyticus TaxID=342942 RepID=UPI0025A3DAA6|nr:hypothetical protein [Mediterraneibacter glycyrrhizinilyticus]MDM8209873.1 hypothetical protein [Mediterraneibacter glycyrrhizinilyticus]